MEPLKLELPALDGLPDAVAALYERDEAAGVYRLGVDLEESALQRALRGERTIRKSAQAAASTASAEATAAAAARDAALAEAKAAKSLLLTAKIASAAQAFGLHACAIDDACRAGREVFGLDANGNVTDAKGGKLTLAQWLGDSRLTSPHWHPGVGGSGSPHQSHDYGTSPRVMRRSEFDRLTAPQKGAQLASGTQITD